MNDRAATSDAPAEPTHEDAAEPTPLAPAEEQARPEPAPTLEDRVHQLEEKVAGLEDIDRLEARVADRVARRMTRKQAITAIQPPVAAIAPAVTAPVALPAPPPPPPVVLREGKAAERPWLLADVFSEFRAMLRMFLDGRYRLFYMTWQTKVYPPLLLGLMVLSWLLISAIPIIGFALDKTVALILAFFLYKVLSREAHRYREISPQLKNAGYR